MAAPPLSSCFSHFEQMDKDQFLLPMGIFATSILLSHYLNLVDKPKISCGNNTLQQIVSKCPSLQSIYWPPPLCHNRHVQLIPFTIRGLIDIAYPPFKYYREEFVLEDGETINLDWVVCKKTLHGLGEDECDETPIVILHHGAMCHTHDIPGQGYIQQALSRGWIVCCFNRRGHGRKLTRPKWNFFGTMSDVHEVTVSIMNRRPMCSIFMIGLSAGSGVIARYFGEMDNCTAGVGVCPGYNIEACMGRFKDPYQSYLLAKVKEFFLTNNHEVLHEVEGYQECLSAGDLQQWLDCAYKMAGYDCKQDYYEGSNPMRVAHNISKPCLFINSEDDPLCVVENVHDNVHVLQTGASAAVAVTKTGSHCSFYEGVFMTSWAERAAYEFLDAVVAHNSCKAEDQ